MRPATRHLEPSCGRLLIHELTGEVGHLKGRRVRFLLQIRARTVAAVNTS